MLVSVEVHAGADMSTYDHVCTCTDMQGRGRAATKLSGVLPAIKSHGNIMTHPPKQHMYVTADLPDPGDIPLGGVSPALGAAVVHLKES